jgi:hypothetical protein
LAFLFAMELRETTMIKKAQLALIAAVAAFAIASPALAQSDYTTGTEASDVRHGYPSPYGHHGHRHGLYAYAPGHGYGHYGHSVHSHYR